MQQKKLQKSSLHHIQICFGNKKYLTLTKKMLDKVVKIVNFIKSRPQQNLFLSSSVSPRAMNIKPCCCIQGSDRS